MEVSARDAAPCHRKPFRSKAMALMNFVAPVVLSYFRISRLRQIVLTQRILHVDGSTRYTRRVIMQRLARAILTRTFFLALCACAGQQLLTPVAPSSPQFKASLAGVSAGAGPPVEIPNHPSFSEFLGIN